MNSIDLKGELRSDKLGITEAFTTKIEAHKIISISRKSREQYFFSGDVWLN